MTPRDKPYDARLAAWLVTPLRHGRVLPNHLTAARLLTGLVGSLLFAGGQWLNVAALLIVISNFLDHTDGELARLSGLQTRFGHQFDLLSDALVTSGMFIGIGLGLRAQLGNPALLMGLVAGVSVAAIFHLRNTLETRHGKRATRQPRWAGFEAEDVLYLVPLMTLTHSLDWFLRAAAFGAPVALMVVLLHGRWFERHLHEVDR